MTVARKAFLIFSLFFTLNLSARVYNGVEVFLAKYTSIVKGKRVALVTNPTGVNGRLAATVDLFRANPRVNLVALFAPEHGIRGNIEAGTFFTGQKDPASGLPVYSLYSAGKHRPPRHILAQVDVIIYSIQDIGCRSYTYIWHMAECMSACAEAGKTMIVLDAPNPLGANVMDGPVMENKYRSFIGLYPIPFVYGLTVGELALYLNRVQKIGCKLFVVPMINYRRGMNWRETGLPWVPTSPQIPSPESACCYAATGVVGTLGTISMGIGYTLPFQVIAAPWINARHMANSLNYLRLPGIKFRPVHFKPYFGLFKGQNIHGVQLHITEVATFKPITATVAILCYLQRTYPRKPLWRADRIEKFDKAMGTASVRRMIQQGSDYRSIVATWRTGINRFRSACSQAKCFIYR